MLTALADEKARVKKARAAKAADGTDEEDEAPEDAPALEHEAVGFVSLCYRLRIDPTRFDHTRSIDPSFDNEVRTREAHLRSIQQELVMGAELHGRPNKTSVAIAGILAPDKWAPPQRSSITNQILMVTPEQVQQRREELDKINLGIAEERLREARLIELLPKESNG